MPPIIAPMLVPMTISGRTPRLSSTRSTPMCASPLAPPPESTSAVFPAMQVWAWTDGAIRSEMRSGARRRMEGENKVHNGPCAAPVHFVYLFDSEVPGLYWRREWWHDVRD